MILCRIMGETGPWQRLGKRNWMWPNFTMKLTLRLKLIAGGKEGKEAPSEAKALNPCGASHVHSGQPCTTLKGNNHAKYLWYSFFAGLTYSVHNAPVKVSGINGVFWRTAAPSQGVYELASFRLLSTTILCTSTVCFDIMFWSNFDPRVAVQPVRKTLRPRLSSFHARTESCDIKVCAIWRRFLWMTIAPVSIQSCLVDQDRITSICWLGFAKADHVCVQVTEPNLQRPAVLWSKTPTWTLPGAKLFLRNCGKSIV